MLPREQRGIDITVCLLLDDRYLQEPCTGEGTRLPTLGRSHPRRHADLCKAPRFDLFWFEKELFAWIPAWAERIVTGTVPYVVDYDEAIFHSYDWHPNSAVMALLGGKIDAVMCRASLLTAPRLPELLRSAAEAS